ncbi:MAG: MotA/TolQ/ExbB proton channel family protein [Leptospira sp.]|nr:MotA/TolQ/ExbB proton channel family protein [Leptospira sp.]
MKEIQLLFLQAGWVAIPLILFSIFSLGLFIYINFKCSVILKSLKSKETSKSKEASVSQSEEEWDELSHSLIVSASWIASIAGLSTLVGLFGTVLGIQAAFRNMQESGQVGLDIFAGGVSLALSTTILGLGVAIPSYILYQIARTKIAGLEKKFFSR